MLAYESYLNDYVNNENNASIIIVVVFVAKFFKPQII